MPSEQKKRLRLALCRESMAVAGLSATHEDSIICPLCWREIRIVDLRLEDYVPKAIGGRWKILTCQPCNNDRGSELDSHLAGYQRMQDAIKGVDSFPTELFVNGARLACELTINESGKEFRVIDKRTNPADIEKSKVEFAAGRVSELNCTVSYRFKKNNFETAALKAGYFAAFNRFGYRYLLDENLQAIRRRICDLELDHPSVRSLVVGMSGLEALEGRQYHIVTGHAGEVRLILVLIRAKMQTTSFLGVYLPAPGAHQPDFFETMNEIALPNRKFAMNLPHDAFVG